MPTLQLQAAAYTRTGIIRRFLDLLAESLPSRVDSAYAEGRLGLKGGDVRAFLQSIRVLGLIDPYGNVTERARRTRGLSHRAAAIREGLAYAYPELVARWDGEGGMARDEVEDFFKVEYGLSASSSGPAAKLFCDLMVAFGQSVPNRPVSDIQNSVALGAESMDFDRSSTGEPTPPVLNTRSQSEGDASVRLAALDAVRSSLKIEINENWDQHRIELVFDRMERLMRLIVGRDSQPD